MVRGGHISSVDEAKSTEFKWNRNLSYGWLREGTIEVVKVNCPLNELHDVVVIVLRLGLQCEGVDGASKMENGGCDAETYEH